MKNCLNETDIAIFFPLELSSSWLGFWMFINENVLLEIPFLLSYVRSESLVDESNINYEYIYQLSNDKLKRFQLLN